TLRGLPTRTMCCKARSNSPPKTHAAPSIVKLNIDQLKFYDNDFTALTHANTQVPLTIIQPDTLLQSSLSFFASNDLDGPSLSVIRFLGGDFGIATAANYGSGNKYDSRTRMVSLYNCFNISSPKSAALHLMGSFSFEKQTHISDTFPENIYTDGKECTILSTHGELLKGKLAGPVTIATLKPSIDSGRIVVSVDYNDEGYAFAYNKCIPLTPKSRPLQYQLLESPTTPPSLPGLGRQPIRYPEFHQLSCHDLLHKAARVVVETAKK
ncbi:MAG: hypothetical protein ACRCZF_16020, partial [Gemmataceae bacterium]